MLEPIPPARGGIPNRLPIGEAFDGEFFRNQRVRSPDVGGPGSVTRRLCLDDGQTGTNASGWVPIDALAMSDRLLARSRLPVPIRSGGHLEYLRIADQPGDVGGPSKRNDRVPHVSGSAVTRTSDPRIANTHNPIRALLTKKGSPPTMRSAE